MTEVAVPLLVEVGRMWAEGRLEVRYEHFTSMRLADFLREARRPFEERARGPHVATTTLPGDLHELGLIMASAVFSLRGWRVIRLGVQTPPGQLASLVRDASLAGAALSISPVVKRRDALEAVTELRRGMPAGTRLWVGGAGAPDGVKGVEVCRGLDELYHSLDHYD